MSYRAAMPRTASAAFFSRTAMATKAANIPGKIMRGGTRF